MRLVFLASDHVACERDEVDGLALAEEASLFQAGGVEELEDEG